MNKEVQKPNDRDISTAPYGSWASPVSGDLLSSQSLGFSDLQFSDGALFWREHRPKEGGRFALMRFSEEEGVAEVGAPSFSAKTRVHEYGGRAVLAAAGGVIASSGDDDQLYRVSPENPSAPLTAIGGLRFADFIEDSYRHRIIAVREDHREEGEPKNTISMIALDDPSADDNQHVLIEGADFYAYPSLSPDGKKIAWVSWDHPNMPWDNTSLWVGDLDEKGEVTNRRELNDGIGDSILQPKWLDNETLYFITDRTGWWNIHVWKNGEVRLVHERNADFGFPLWWVGERHYDFLPGGDIVSRFIEDQRYQLGRIDSKSGTLTPIPLDGGEPGGFVVGEDSVFIVVRYKSAHDVLIEYNTASDETKIIRQINQLAFDSDYIARAEAILFPTGGGEVAYAYLYQPVNPQFCGPMAEKPPLIVKMHGGPTFHSLPYLSYETQFWTTRGFAVLDANYRGSSGFGRDYRRSLYGEWGVKDIEDAVNGALYVAEKGLVDPDRLLIRGGSAGGFAVMASMTRYDIFAAGANYFGVSDMEMFVQDTHKFESRYFDHLVGPYPEKRALFAERSPINHIGQLKSPMITLQGADDKIVPPSQSELIFDALKENGVPTAYLLFEGEGHGFEKAETRKRAMEAELYFYGQVLGFRPADIIEPVTIYNHPSAEGER